MNHRKLKKKLPPRTFNKLLIHSRPDLNQFKPSHGNIFHLPFHSNSTSELPIEAQSSPHSDAKSIDIIPPDPSKNKRNSIPQSKSTKSKIKSKKHKKNHTRIAKDKSPDPDEDSSIDDIAFSDYSEAETKLRDPESRNESHRKFAKLRKARKQSQFKKLLNKEVHSRRIIPDSDDEIELKAAAKCNELTTSDVDDSDDDDSSSGSGSGSDYSSETDEEERKRREREFIVDDMATAEQKNRVQKQLESHMPAKFRNFKHDNLVHFKTVCLYLVHHALLPQIPWREDTAKFDYSCHHLEEYFNKHAMPMLESAAWILNFREELNDRPYIRLLNNPQGKSGCQACNNRTKISKKIIQLTGLKYSTQTLNPVKTKKRLDESDSSTIYDSSSSSEPEDSGIQHKFKLYDPALSDPSKPEFICGEDCANRAMDYHYFKHWKIYILKHMKDRIKAIKEEKSILKKAFKYTDQIPKEGELNLYKREIRQIFKIIENDDSVMSLGNLLQRVMNRLNRLRRNYANVG